MIDFDFFDSFDLFDISIIGGLSEEMEEDRRNTKRIEDGWNQDQDDENYF